MTGADGWVLYRAENDLGPWLRWSAAAHSLLLGALFAGMLLLTAGQVLVERLPGGAAGHARGYLTAAIILCLGPFVLLALRKHARRCTALALDPMGFTLRTRGGRERRLDLEDLAGVEVVAEPTFSDVGLRWTGSARTAPPTSGFVPTLRLRARNGQVWEYPTSRVPEVEGFLAWLDVLGARERLRMPPSSLAAAIGAQDALRAGRRLLTAALGAATATTALIITHRMMPSSGSLALGLSLFTVAVACALYVGSFLGQVQAAKGWLISRGLAAGPPVEDPAERAALPLAPELRTEELGAPEAPATESPAAR